LESSSLLCRGAPNERLQRTPFSIWLVVKELERAWDRSPLKRSGGRLIEFFQGRRIMRRLSLRISVTFLAFLVGVVATTVWLSVSREPPLNQPAKAVNKPSPVSPGGEPIDAAGAIHLAECFLIGNGYTELPPMEDKSKLSYESWDDGPPAEKALERRRDTVESTAYGVMKGGRSKDGWVVVFRYNINHPSYDRFRPEFQEHLKTVGRTVTMDKYGGGMRVEHQDFELNKSQRVEKVTP
jgi:hypothetical protein